MTTGVASRGEDGDDAAPLLGRSQDEDDPPRDYGATGGAIADSDRESIPESASTDSEVQDGVRRIEAVARAWSKWALIVTYLSVLLMAFTTSLEGQVTYPLAAFAVSSFDNHSLLSTVFVVQNVVNGTHGHA